MIYDDNADHEMKNVSFDVDILRFDDQDQEIENLVVDVHIFSFHFDDQHSEIDDFLVDAHLYCIQDVDYVRPDVREMTMML